MRTITWMLGLWLWCAGCWGGEPPRTVVLVLVDTLRYDALSCNGGARDTPAMDSLAAEGVRFEQAIASSGWTLPSVASLLTGVSPPVHHARGKVSRLTPISPDLATGAELLNAAGVRTVAFTNAAFVNPLLGLTRGFELVSHEHAYNDSLRRADRTIDLALQALEQGDGRDTLCLIHLFDAHLDYDPPAPYDLFYLDGLADPTRPIAYLDCTSVAPGVLEDPPAPEHVARVVAAYDAEVRFVDAQIARLLQAIAASPGAARTTVVLTSDHGEEFWEHNSFEHGHSLYDELIRVPLILRPAPELAIAPRVVPDQVRLIDVMPTLFEIFEQPLPDIFEGRSLMPLLRGEPDGEVRPALSDGTLYGHDKVSLRTKRYKYVFDRDPEATAPDELYDWTVDPGETRNLAAEEPQVLERLRNRLRQTLLELERRGQAYAPGEVQDLAPAAREEILRQLDSLGYAEGE